MAVLETGSALSHSLFANPADLSQDAKARRDPDASYVFLRGEECEYWGDALG